MTVYSYSQLEQLWIQAGGPSSLAPLMAAIAEAESGGNSDAHSPTDDWGLWQINRPVWGAAMASTDPMTNARSAVHVWKVQGLTAWTTYKTGAYKSHLQGNVPPGTGTLPGGGGGGGSGASNATLTVNPNPGNGGEIGTIIGSIIPGFGQIWGGIFGSAGTPQTDIGSIASDLQVMIKASMWLYNPANWLRIGAFFFGIILLIGSGWMFKEAI